MHALNTINKDAAIAIEGLSKRYDDFTLANFSLTVPLGQVAALVGSNGAGKTTVIKSLFATYKPDAGTVRILNDPVLFNDDAVGASIRSHLGFVFDTAPYGSIKVSALAAIGRANYYNFQENHFYESLASIGIKESDNANKLSRGMSMRLQLAFAFAHNPEILILDEPTAGLDPMATQDVLEDLRVFMDDPRHAILISSHDTKDLEELADTVTCLHKGRTIFSETLEDLQTHYGLLSLPKQEAARLIPNLVSQHIDVFTEKNTLNTALLVRDCAGASNLLDNHVNFRMPHIDEVMNMMIRGNYENGT